MCFYLPAVITFVPCAKKAAPLFRDYCSRTVRHDDGEPEIASFSLPYK